MRHPAIEAEVVLESEHAYHMGGFCLPHGPPNASVARLRVDVDWQGKSMLPTGPGSGATLLVFTGEENWGKARAGWSSSSCSEKLQAAFAQVNLGRFQNRTGAPRYSVHANVKSTATLDWHFALAACGTVEQAPLRVSVHAVDGALSVFQANTQFDDSSCPRLPVSWWREATSRPSFWVMMLAMVLGTCSCVLLAFFLLRCHIRKGSKPSNPGAHLVIGRPCQQMREVEAPPGKETE